MKLVVGLGNPGTQYDKTRHNVGFVVLDSLARRHAPGEVAKSRFHGATVEGTIDGEKVLLLKPLCYMNRSGMAVAEAVRFYKLDPAEQLLVIVDDLALPCGVIRLRGEGGRAGTTACRTFSKDSAPTATRGFASASTAIRRSRSRITSSGDSVPINLN